MNLCIFDQEGREGQVGLAQDISLTKPVASELDQPTRNVGTFRKYITPRMGNTDPTRPRISGS